MPPPLGITVSLRLRHTPPHEWMPFDRRHLHAGAADAIGSHARLRHIYDGIDYHFQSVTSAVIAAVTFYWLRHIIAMPPYYAALMPPDDIDAAYYAYLG